MEFYQYSFNLPVKALRAVDEMSSLRVKPSDFARDRAAAREKSIALRNAQIEAELENATFKPELATSRRRPLMDVPPRTLEELVREQMGNSNPEERPLPATIQKLNMLDNEMPVEVDSLNAAMRAERAPKSPKKHESQPSKLVTTSSENVENSVGVYFPRESVESLNLKERPKRGPSQAQSDTDFKLSLRAEVDNYNIDAVVPVGAIKTASLRAKGGLEPKRVPTLLSAAATAATAATEDAAASATIQTQCMPKTPQSGGRGVSGIPRSNSGSGKRRSRPSSAHIAVASPTHAALTNAAPAPANAHVNSGDKVKARSRLSLLKSKMPKRMSESARGRNRPPMPGVSPIAGSKERRRASLSAAVTRFQDRLSSGEEQSAGEEIGVESANVPQPGVNMYTSASESQLRFTESMRKASGPKVGKSGPGVKKAAKLDRPILRPRREADCEGFDPVTGEPLSPTIYPLSTAGSAAKLGDNLNTTDNESDSKENTMDYSNVYQSVEIHHKESAEVMVPDIYLDLPPDAFSNSAAAGSLVGCPHCDRRFSETSMPRHVKVCKTVFLAKPKVFNSSRMRISGVAELNKPDNTEMKLLESAVNSTDNAPLTSLNSPTAARLIRKQKRAEEKKAAKAAKAEKGKDKDRNANRERKWKSQSNALRRAMLEARGKSTAHMDSMTGAQLDMASNLVPCPHCNRKFNHKAADRHIPQCQSIKAKPATLKKGSGKMAVAASKPASTLAKIMTRFM